MPRTDTAVYICKIAAPSFILQPNAQHRVSHVIVRALGPTQAARARGRELPTWTQTSMHEHAAAASPCCTIMLTRGAVVLLWYSALLHHHVHVIQVIDYASVLGVDLAQ